jgi:LPS-assembly lipoprotein
MCWGKEIGQLRHLARIAFVIGLGALTGACFQPLYGKQTIPGGDSVGDKLGAIQIPEIQAPKGTPAARMAVALRNALITDFSSTDNPVSPMYRLEVTGLGGGPSVIVVDVSSGRADAEVEGISARFSLIELASNKAVLSDSTFARASFDIPGSEQRFARQRANRAAEDRAVELLAQNIRNRLASFFVAGT